MAVHIRLRRMGTKKRPFYRIVAADSRRARNGRFLEILGFYDPIKKPAEVKVHTDKLTKWLDDGAIPSDTVSSLLTQVGYSELYEKIKGKSWNDEWDLYLKINRRFPGKTVIHLIVGLGETEIEMVRAIETFYRHNSEVSLFAFTPIPGTPLSGRKQPNEK